MIQSISLRNHIFFFVVCHPKNCLIFFFTVLEWLPILVGYIHFSFLTPVSFEGGRLCFLWGCVCVFFLLFEVSFFKSSTNLSSSYWPELCHVPIPKPVISNRGIVVLTKIIRLISGVENGVKFPLEEIQALWKGSDP